MSKIPGTSWILSIALVVGLACTGMAPAIGADYSSKALVYKWWDAYTVVGQSMLHRSDNGLKATFKINADQTDADRVFTLWFIIFNSPEGCATSPCTADDVFNPDADADFLYGGGTVTTQNKVEFGGSVAAYDTSGSGMIEIGSPELALGLIDPHNAEVHLAIHSHGPGGSGTYLKEQISSFLGGCLVFLGPGGLATGPEDVPDEEGECSTIMFSVHQP